VTFLNRINLLWSDGPRAFQLFQVIRQATAIVIGIILAKSSLPLGEIGKYELWMYIASIWAYFWFQGTNQAFIAWYPKLPADQQSRAFTSLFLIHHAFSLFFILIFLWKNGFVGRWLAQSSEVPLYSDLLILLPPFLISSVIPIFLMLRNLLKALFTYSVFYLVSQLLAVLVPIFTGFGISGIMTGLMVTALIHYIILITILANTGVFGLVHKTYFNQLLRSVWPLIAYTVIGAFAPLFDAWLVNFVFSSSEVFAIFRYGAKELPLSLALAGAFHMGMIAELARDDGSGLHRIRQGAVRFMKWFFPITILLIIISKPLYTMIFSPLFVESAGIFNIYLLIVVSRWFFPHSILIAK
jgi:O-antigen/teichoic acid export membrane protein